MVKALSWVSHSQGTEFPQPAQFIWSLVCQATQARDVPKHPRHTSQAIPRALVGLKPGPDFCSCVPSIPSLKPENRCRNCGRFRASLAALLGSGPIPSKDPNFTLQMGNLGPEGKKTGLPRPPPSWNSQWSPASRLFPVPPGWLRKASATGALNLAGSSSLGNFSRTRQIGARSGLCVPPARTPFLPRFPGGLVPSSHRAYARGGRPGQLPRSLGDQVYSPGTLVRTARARLPGLEGQQPDRQAGDPDPLKATEAVAIYRGNRAQSLLGASDS